ncbi:MAG: hypothetical protein IJW79_00880, partial [Clostridia bacterium]|nr:hypothetical protein [Clostridia bacterium]
NLVQHFIKRYSRYGTVFLKLQDNFLFLRKFDSKNYSTHNVGAVLVFVGETCGLPLANAVRPYKVKI